LSRYNRSSVKKRADKTVPELLADIEAAYTALLAKLETLSEADLDKTGRHARGDTLTLEGFFRRTSEHRRMHAQELQKAVGG
ncbi:MAG: DinB family protein, partial [Anaerolineales bacterium]|nr:DinB family protein [Anaerolineales bacterium]